MIDFLDKLDRRYIFLMMLLSVAIPILIQLQFPETPSGEAKAVFDEIEALQPGDKVLMAFDYDPSGEGELGPMATAFVRHCSEKKLKMYFVTLWPAGSQMIDDTINKVIKKDFRHLVYGTDYVHLGYKSGYEGVIKVIVTDLRGLYKTDATGTNIDEIPMCRDVESVQDMDLVVNVSAGYAGTKEWVQYAVAAYPDKIKLVSGCTGVQAPLFYPYYPEQLKGLLGAIKGAAEYEEMVNDEYDAKKNRTTSPIYLEAKRRMGPQLVAHILMVVFIVLGNLVFFMTRNRGSQTA